MIPIKREIWGEFAARIVVGALFTLLSINLLGDFMRTGRITGLLLLVSEALVVVLMIFRRPARLIDRSVGAAIATALSLSGPPLLRTANTAGLVPDLATALVSAIGLTLVIVGKLSLGRSFGIAPANRGIVTRGLYARVRHPIYAGYLLTHIAFVAAYPRPWNVMIILIADSALIIRALIEERVLLADAEYLEYSRRVGWHLLPGVF